MSVTDKVKSLLRHRAASPAPGQEAVIALAGNPNVGKSTVFNRLTGLKQHTGNWPGKTVDAAEGFFERDGRRLRVVDIPGMYSLTPRSPEEQTAVEFLCAGRADAVAVVCDAGCLVRGISFVLEMAELTDRPIIVCVNLIDEAGRRGIRVDTGRLSALLGMPVVASSAASGKGLGELAACMAKASAGGRRRNCPATYPLPVEEKLRRLASAVAACAGKNAPGVRPRFFALKLLQDDSDPFVRSIADASGMAPEMRERLRSLARECREELAAGGLDGGKLTATVISRRMITAGAICEQCVSKDSGRQRAVSDVRLDRFFTGRVSGRLCMLLLLCLVFWLTIVGANYPSEWLSGVFGRLEPALRSRLDGWGMSSFARGLLVDGVYRVLTRIIAVMLPPMAIFFPLFTLLEDAGYLPRAAFNLDASLCRCGACGKQALTTCMGFGCNAVGVTGCRIIDSPRERLIAILTNSFIPCNGRFPMLTALIALFLTGSVAPPLDSLLGAALLTGLICLGLAASFGASKLLSLTLLRGEPSSFALELPPFRKPRIGSVIVRSMLDRTLFVLGRAAAVAAPAGAVIWLTANVRAGGESILSVICRFLEPAGQLLGMDGVILTAFLLGLPANEIVIPLIIMAYMAQGSLNGLNDAGAVHSLLLANGWTVGRAVCVMLFTLMHWPCATTCVTIFRETRSLKWTALAVLIPTAAGCAVCAAAAALFRMAGMM